MCGELHPDLTSAGADSVSGPPAEEQSAGHLPVRSDGGLVARLLPAGPQCWSELRRLETEQLTGTELVLLRLIR